MNIKQKYDPNEWVQRTKSRAIKAMGGECILCGLNTNPANLVFHHIIPATKLFTISSWRVRNWNKIVIELRKCVMLCHNCHCEVHEELTLVPINYPKFDEMYADYVEMERLAKFTPCSLCGIMKRPNQKYCSIECTNKGMWHIDWDQFDLKKELETKSFCALGRELGCSDNAIRKRITKLKKENKW